MKNTPARRISGPIGKEVHVHAAAVWFCGRPFWYSMYWSTKVVEIRLVVAGHHRLSLRERLVLQ